MDRLCSDCSCERVILLGGLPYVLINLSQRLGFGGRYVSADGTQAIDASLKKTNLLPTPGTIRHPSNLFGNNTDLRP